MAEKSEHYVEWSYENLSYWKSEIHGRFLSYRDFPLRLYPRGLNGDGERVVAQVFDPCRPSGLELSYIGAEGSLICQQEIKDPQWDGSWLTLPPGPKFEDAVRKRENKDVLVLKLYRNNYFLFQYGRSMIHFVDRCIKIPSSIFKNYDEESGVWIASFSNNIGDKVIELDLRADLEDPSGVDSKIRFTLSPYFGTNTPEHMLICTCISHFDGNDIVIESEENKHIFSRENDGDWTFFSILRLKEFEKYGYDLILCVKFISGDILHVMSLECVESITNKPYLLSKKANNLTENFNVSTNSPVSVLSVELMCLYKDRDFSDFQLKCGEVSFPVHKAILGARSPVFKTMLSTDMQEAASNSVDIVDLDPSTLARFLSFLYTGIVEDLQSDSALKLYYAADKYQVPSLKGECVSVLCAQVSVANVCDILLLADHHQDDKIMCVAHKFILKNFNEVLRSKEWENLMKRDPFLTSKTITLFARKKCLEVINTF